MHPNLNSRPSSTALTPAEQREVPRSSGTAGFGTAFGLFRADDHVVGCCSVHRRNRRRSPLLGEADRASDLIEQRPLMVELVRWG
ncbi:MAG: hypothetical protein JWN47_2627, partial [Frankiales bacterium]|nr:hypothetical protein [Frankiales bacterium]